ncbi:MAG: phosphate acyltransferase PlsX [Candidatus Calescibacterium sp.]|nr:phosphate acyltransferase PlsX [Candidatus Calescibacterium sp.]MCX7971706.1 phosphate acyltransferase PlsX [bacterium]MDW8195312.1 phosphate acyltransferase PlsX [Candidatus Calescibacterium sp.]
MVTIGIDLMGGDNAPLSVIEGIFHSIIENKDLNILATYYKNIDINEMIKKIYNFSPKRSKIKNFIKSNEWKHRIDFVPCDNYISMQDKPSSLLKNKSDTLRTIFEMLRDGKIDGVVYAGNTGAFLEGSVLFVGRIENVRRPALLTALPFGNHPVFLLDSGANSECKPEYILQFAIMSSSYYRIVISRKPSVGVLNIGKEEIKGNNLVKEANNLIKSYVEKNPNLFTYHGFIEPYDVVNSKINIVLADGFSGNIMLKSFEALSEYVMEVMKKEFSKGIINKALGLILRSNFRRLKNFFDYSEYGGAIMLGLKGICIKTHGRANYKAIKNSILFTYKLIKNDMIKKIGEEIKNVELWTT